LSLQSREWIIRYKFKNVKDIPSDVKGGEILDKQVVEGFATHFSIKAQHTKDSKNAKFYREIAREIREGLKNVAGN
jgi:hypothetical protein